MLDNIIITVLMYYKIYKYSIKNISSILKLSENNVLEIILLYGNIELIDEKSKIILY